jgi:hypothetical protein
MKRLFYSLVSLFGLLGANLTQAYDVTVEFSAEAVQKAPARADYHARMYVSKDSVRTESVLNNTPVVEIVNSKDKTRTLLVPKEKVYMQQKADQTSVAGKTGQSNSKKPCAGLPDTTCKMLGKETVNSRQTEKWEFIVKRNGQDLRSLHWIDVKRKMPIREFFPDGTVTELILQGTEKINGRKTEKWKMQITRSDGQQMVSTQWYDPELKLSIREEMSGGFVRELRDIKIGKQDETLFSIPTDYTKVTQLPGYLMSQQPESRPGY